MSTTTAAPATTPRARRVAHELCNIQFKSAWLFDFHAEGDQVVATPVKGLNYPRCTYSFPRTWGPMRIDTFLNARLEEYDA